MLRQPLLILRLSALGDIIHTIPAVVAIRRSRPEYAIGWIVEDRYRDLVEAVAPIDMVFPVQTRRWRQNPLNGQNRHEILSFVREIRTFARGGTSIDFQSLLKSSMLGWLSKARHRLGFQTAAVRERASTLFTNRQVEIDTSTHVIAWNMQLAVALGATSVDPMTVDYSRFPRDDSGMLSILMQKSPVLLVPGAGRKEKQWPAALFAALAIRIAAELDKEVVVGWGPREESLAHEIAERSGVARVAPPTGLRELAFLLKNASCVVGGDTGPIHMAAALRAPVVGLYGPTDPARNGPWGQVGRCVGTWSKSRRMDEISINDVMQSVQSVLADAPTEPR